MSGRSVAPLPQCAPPVNRQAGTAPHRIVRGLLVLLLVLPLGLAACAKRSVDDGPITGRQAAESNNSIKNDRDAQGRSGASNTPESKKTAYKIPSRMETDPDDLKSMSPYELIAALGRPDLQRREKPAEVWQYEAKECVVDIVLFDKGRGAKVTYLESRDRQGNRHDVESCLRKVERYRQSDSFLSS